VPVSIFLLGVAVLLPGPMFKLSEKANTPAGKLVFALLGDLFAACFFAALACAIIGALRNRRWRKEDNSGVATP
jgi:hypothetical protein